MKDPKKNLEFICSDGSKANHWEDFANNRPFKTGKTLPKLMDKGGPKRIEGRKIVSASPFMGSYGMGGPGFFGLELEKKGRYPKEWLVLTMWGADQWLRVNNKWLNCHPDFWNPGQCYFPTYEPDKCENRINELFKGRIINKFVIGPKWFKLAFDKSPLVLELPSDLSVLPPHGNGQRRQWCIGEKMEDGFILSPTPYIDI